MSIQARLHFVQPEFRGYRLPNQWSAEDAGNPSIARSAHDVIVHNARLIDPPPTLDSHGFQLINDPLDMELMDTEVVKNGFYPRCAEILRRATGCVDVRGGGHEYRTGFGGETGRRAVKPTPNGSAGNYAMGIHADMCAAIERAFAKNIPDDRHFESINIWRSTKPGELVQMMPLAVCDMRSVDPDDIVFGDGVNTGDVRQFYKVVSQMVVFNPNQRWYYFPNMRDDEVLIFRQYDTRQDALNLRTVFHTAVPDPAMPDDAPMRSTIEVRMQAIYGKETNKAERLDRFLAEISDRYPNGQKTNWWTGPIENYVPPPEYRN